MSRPKLSVVMPVHNGERYLREAVESVLNQTFTDFEFIIINDGSTDTTQAILENYPDSRLVVVNREHQGLVASLNQGLTLARGEYVARQDADDISLSTRFATQIDYLDKNPEVVLVTSDYEIIDSKGCLLGRMRREGDPSLVAWYLLFYNHVAGHSLVVFRRDPVVDLGGYSGRRRHIEDYDLWLRLSNVADIVILPDVLLRWRMHDESISSQCNKEQEASAVDLAREFIMDLIGAEISLDEVWELRGFWLHRFPNTQRAGSLHARLKVIYQAFLQQRLRHSTAAPELSSHLRKAVGERFLNWIQFLLSKSCMFSVTKILVYALAWDPMRVLTWGLKGSLRALLPRSSA